MIQLFLLTYLVLTIYKLAPGDYGRDYDNSGGGVEKERSQTRVEALERVGETADCELRPWLGLGRVMPKSRLLMDRDLERNT